MQVRRADFAPERAGIAVGEVSEIRDEQRDEGWLEIDAVVIVRAGRTAEETKRVRRHAVLDPVRGDAVFVRDADLVGEAPQVRRKRADDPLDFLAGDALPGGFGFHGEKCAGAGFRRPRGIRKSAPKRTYAAWRLPRAAFITKSVASISTMATGSATFHEPRNGAMA